jgi:hypothetical protein
MALSNVSGYVEVVNSGAPRFTNANQGDMAIYTDCNIQSILIGTGQGSNSMLKIGERSLITSGNALITGNTVTALSNIRDFSGTYPTLCNVGTFSVSGLTPNTVATPYGSIDITSGYYTFSNNGSLFPNSNIAHSNIMSTDFTIESWVYYTANPTFATPYLIGNMSPDNSGLSYWSFGLTPQRQLGFYVFANNASGSSIQTQSNIVPLNTWTHIGVTYSNNARSLSLYVNGVAQSNLSLSGAGVWTIPSASSTTASNTSISHTGPGLSYVTLGRYVTSNNACLLHDFRVTMGTASALSTSLPSAAITGTRLLLRAGLITTRPIAPFVIGANGFIGMNNSNPQYIMDVAGDINVTGTLRQNGVPFAGSNAPLPYAFVFGDTGSTTVLANGKVPFNRVFVDTASAWNTTNYNYTIPESGRYAINITAYVNSSTNNGNRLFLGVNNVAHMIILGFDGTTDMGYSGSLIRSFNSGDVVDFRLWFQAVMFFSSNSPNYFHSSASITRIPDTSGSSGSGALTNTAGQIMGVSNDNALLPTYTWSGDSNTGMYHDANGRIAFSCFGSNVLTIGSSGNGFRARVAGASTGNTDALLIVNNTSTGSSLTGNANAWNNSVAFTGIGRAWAMGVETTNLSNYALGFFNYNTTDLTGTRYIRGYVSAADAGTSTIMNFTGQHRCFVKDMSVDEINSNVGLIVVANQNNYIKMSHGVATGKEAITQDEALPIVQLACHNEDKTVFGVISAHEDPERRVDEFGAFMTPYDKEIGDTRAYINSLGEGGIWVTDINGHLTSGDYITTTTIPGYGGKQQSGQLMNYTVAKITMDCDFDPPMVAKKQIKKILHDIFKDEVVTVDSTVIEEKEDIVYDQATGRWTKKVVQIERIIKETVHDEVDLYDESGNIIGKHQVPRKITRKVYEQVNDLDEKGNMQWEDVLDDEGDPVLEPAYETRYISASGARMSQEEYEQAIQDNEVAYKAAFVGCTYHCG